MSEENEYLRLGDVPSKLEEMGYPRSHKSIAYRWAGRGVRGVKLRTVHLGGKKLTTIKWLEDFMRRTEDCSDETKAMVSNGREHAKQELERDGI